MAAKALKGAVVALNNRLTRWRGQRVPAGSLLVLLPRCLQNDDCGRPVQRDVSACGRCGRCPVAGILRLQERYGFRTLVATGGRQAVKAVKDPTVKAVVAVACVEELFAGVIRALPKPVLAIANRHPCGPCHNTGVDLEAVEAAVQALTTNGARDEHQGA